MLTNEQKNILENKIYNILKESMFENFFQENMFSEKKNHKKKHHHHDNTIKDSDISKKDINDKKGSVKRASVMKWLSSVQIKHSQLAYDLWPEMSEDDARSLFTKKYQGHDADGNPYSFDDDDITKLFNMKDRYMDRLSENIDNALDNVFKQYL